jgi:hypothetical protein
LEIDDNEIYDEGVEILAEGVSKLQNLISLNLKFERNKICDEGAKKLGEGVSKLLKLTSLEV